MSLLEVTTYFPAPEGDEMPAADNPLVRNRLASDAERRIRALDAAWGRALKALADVNPAMTSAFLLASDSFRRSLPDLQRDLTDIRRETQPAVSEHYRQLREQYEARRATAALDAGEQA